MRFIIFIIVELLLLIGIYYFGNPSNWILFFIFVTLYEIVQWSDGRTSNN